jgi:heat-inducible transcriptional repressor
VFVDQLLDPQQLAEVERREIAVGFDAPTGDGVMHEASRTLSERTRQLGFVLPPRIGRIVVRHLSLVRLSKERVLVVLITRTGVTHRRVVIDDAWGAQTELDRVARLLNERIAGRTLEEIRTLFAEEAAHLRRRAMRLAERAVRIGAQALATLAEPGVDLVVATRLALLDHPESDPSLLRELLEAVESKEQLVTLLDRVLDAQGVHVSFGWESDRPGLERCAIVTAPYGDPGAPLGLVGVLGPSHMNYGRVIPLVDFLSQLVTERLAA